jgi:large subunit ribosomal protein L9
VPNWKRLAAEKLAAAQGVADKMTGIVCRPSPARPVWMAVCLVPSVPTISLMHSRRLVSIVDKASIRMPEGPLKAIGEFPLDVALHTDVLANITVAVVAE